MTNKRLSETEVEQMKLMVVGGIPPQTIADHFKISISSVHNWKSRFAQEGVEFPSVKGRRRLDQMTVPGNHSPALRSDYYNNPTSNVTPLNQPLRLTINGIALQIPANAKAVQIGSDNSVNIQLI